MLVPKLHALMKRRRAEEQRKLDVLLSLRLTETTRNDRSLEEIMSDISREAQERGLTPEILESLLNER